MSKTYKIVVVSDNHGRKQVLEQIRELHKDADYFIHCGDSEMMEFELAGYAHVKGNSDYIQTLPDSLILTVGSHRIFVVHGHRHIIFGQFNALVSTAHTKACDIVCYGHTHIYRDDEIDGIRLLNPGSLRYNRDATPPSYMILEIAGNKITTNRMNLSY